MSGNQARRSAERPWSPSDAGSFLPTYRRRIFLRLRSNNSCAKHMLSGLNGATQHDSSTSRLSKTLTAVTQTKSLLGPSVTTQGAPGSGVLCCDRACTLHSASVLSSRSLRAGRALSQRPLLPQGHQPPPALPRRLLQQPDRPSLLLPLPCRLLLP